MLEITKSYVFDEQNRPLAVQIPIEVFTRIEEILENHGLSVVMDETKDKVETVKESVFQDLSGILTSSLGISVEEMAVSVCIKDDVSELPEEAQQMIVDYIQFLKYRYGSHTQQKTISFKDQPFVGMWSDRSEMADGSWLRRLRDQQWQ